MIAGKINVDIEQRYPLAEAARAHQDLEVRKTVGSSVLAARVGRRRNGGAAAVRRRRLFGAEFTGISCQ